MSENYQRGNCPKCGRGWFEDGTCTECGLTPLSYTERGTRLPRREVRFGGFRRKKGGKDE